MNTQIQKIIHSSAEWKQARKIRHELFFKKHQLPEAIMDDEIELRAIHYAIVDNKEVLAYLRLDEKENNYFISQMVVHRNYQNRGLGSKLITQVLERIPNNFKSIELNARLTAVAFYENLGFEICGDQFNSQSTAVPHFPMKMKINKKELS